MLKPTEPHHSADAATDQAKDPNGNEPDVAAGVGCEKRYVVGLVP